MAFLLPCCKFNPPGDYLDVQQVDVSFVYQNDIPRDVQFSATGDLSISSYQTYSTDCPDGSENDTEEGNAEGYQNGDPEFAVPTSRHAVCGIFPFDSHASISLPIQTQYDVTSCSNHVTHNFVDGNAVVTARFQIGCPDLNFQAPLYLISVAASGYSTDYNAEVDVTDLDSSGSYTFTFLGATFTGTLYNTWNPGWAQKDNFSGNMTLTASLSLQMTVA